MSTVAKVLVPVDVTLPAIDVNVPAAAELAPITAPSIAPPLISTVVNVEVPVDVISPVTSPVKSPAKASAVILPRLGLYINPAS